MKCIIGAIAGATLLSGMVGQSHAQSIGADVIGQMIAGNAAEAACMSGRTTFSEKERARLSEALTAKMAAYVALAGAAETADVRRAFYKKTQFWSRDGVLGDVKVVSDPLARALAVATLPAPDRFEEAGDKQTAIGQWLVKDAQEPTRLVGSYTATFIRQGGWTLIAVDLKTGPEEPKPLTPYCHNRGDVDEARAKAAEAAAAKAAAETPGAH